MHPFPHPSPHTMRRVEFSSLVRLNTSADGSCHNGAETERNPDRLSKMNCHSRKGLLRLCSFFVAVFTAVSCLLLITIDGELREKRKRDLSSDSNSNIDLDYFLRRLYALNAESNVQLPSLANIQSDKRNTVEQMLNIIKECGKPNRNEQLTNFQSTWNSTLVKFIRKSVGDYLQERGRKQKNDAEQAEPINDSDFPGMGYSSYKQFTEGISKQGLYQEDDHIDTVIKDLMHKPIVDMQDLSDEQTSLKLLFKLEGGLIGIFKPKRVERDYIVPADAFYMDEIPRHFAEIASFHLDRVLGWRRVPPAVGRMVDIQRDILPYASEDLNDTFFISPAGNPCLYGLCSHFCSPRTPVCSHNGLLEGSMSLFIPESAHIISHRNPWMRTYKRNQPLALWQKYPSTFCMETLLKHGLSKGRRLLDIIDLHILDFLIGNEDRHHYYTLNSLGSETFVLALDNDSGFGRPYIDQDLLLSPLKQCCKIRLSTLEILLSFTPSFDEHSLNNKTKENFESLPQALEKSLLRETAVSEPILTRGHLVAMDRRIGKVFEAVQECINSDRDLTYVIYDDGY